MLKKYFLLTAILFSTCFVLTQNKLQYNLSKGDSFSVLQESTQRIKQELMGMKQDITNNLGGIMKFTVTDVNEDNYTMNMSYTKFIMKMSSPTMGILMDVDTSNAPGENDMQGLLFQGLLNQDITFVMKKDGDIVSLTGSENLMKGMLEKANINSPEIANTIKSSLKNQWGDETLINSIEQLLFLYGDAKNTEGATWLNDYSGNVTAKNSWKVDTTNGYKATISANTDVKMDIVNEQITMSLSGTQQTVATVNTKTGLFSTLETTGQTKGQAKSAQLPDTDIPVIIDFKNSYKTIN